MEAELYVELFCAMRTAWNAKDIMGVLDHAVMLTNHYHCLVINKHHPLGQKEKITYKDLDVEPIALEGRNFVVINNIVNAILMAGGTPNIVMETTYGKISQYKFKTPKAVRQV